MNSEDSLEASGNELSTVDDDFNSLVEEEDIKVDAENKKDILNFNELFEQISEECRDSVEIIAGDSAGGNVDDDFEALLDYEIIGSPQGNKENNPKEAKTDVDKENNAGSYSAKDDNKETFLGMNMDKGFTQIFASENSQELLQNSSDTKLVNPNLDTEQRKQVPELFLLDGKNQEEKIVALNRLVIEERNSFQVQIKQKEKEISTLMDEVEKLRNSLSQVETEKDLSEERLLNLLEKQRVDSPLTAVREFGLDREEELLSQIDILNEKINVQDDIIFKMKEENTALRNINQCAKGTLQNTYSDDEEKLEDPKQKIILLEHELKDQQEVSEKLKAYVGEVLENVMVTNPQMLERK